MLANHRQLRRGLEEDEADLYNNKLTDVPKGLEKLTKLEVLVLQANQLTDVKGLTSYAVNGTVARPQ